MSPSKKQKPRFNHVWVREALRVRGVTVDDAAAATERKAGTVKSWFTSTDSERRSPRGDDAAVLAVLIDAPLGSLYGLEKPRSMDY